jgi:putative membrane protein
MLYIICTLAAVAAAVLVASKVLPGVRVKDTGTLVAVAVVFGILNVIFGWGLKVLLALLTLPAVILTGGLFYGLIVLGVNCLLVWITDKVLENFEITQRSSLYWTALFVSIAMYVVNRLV